MIANDSFIHSDIYYDDNIDIYINSIDIFNNTSNELDG